MRLTPWLLILILLGGCTAFGKRTDDGTAQSKVKSASETALSDTIRSKQPPSFVYSPTVCVGKGGTATLPAVTFPPNEVVENRTVQKNLTENIEAKEKSTWSITETSGLFYPLIAISFCLIVGAYLAFSHLSTLGEGVDSTAGTLVKELKAATPGTPVHDALSRVEDEVLYWKDKSKGIASKLLNIFK